MSLVQPGRPQRYRLHPLLRDYARKKLQDDSFEEAMIDYFVEFTQKNRLETAVMRRERGNIEYALKLACDKGKFTAFIRGVNAYYRFLLATGSLVVAEDYLRKAQEAGQHIDDQSIVAVSTHYLGQVREKLGDFIQAENYFQQALQLAQQADAIEVMGGVLVNLGVLSARQGQSDEAERYWNQALDYAGQGQEHENVCAILSNLGALATIRGDYSKAKLYYEQGLATATKWRHEHRMPSLFINLGNLLQKQGDITQAKELYEKALALSRKLEYVFEISVSLQHLGELAQYNGDYSQAREFYKESLKLAQQSHLKSRMSRVLASLGEVLWLGGDIERGTTRLSEGLILARSIEGANNHMTISILNMWGRLQLEIGNLETAQEAFTEALAIATKVGSQELRAMSLFGLSRADFESGNVAAAQEKSRQSFEILSKIGHIEAANVQKWREAFQMEQVTSQDGTLIGFKRSGAGRPLVLVHGTTADHRRWSAVAPRFEEHFTVYAIDRRGRGASDDGSDYHLKREAEDVAAVVDSIGEPVFLLGHSYGAVCGLEASLLTDKIGRLILYEPPIPTGLPMYPPGLPDKIQALADSGKLEAALELFFQKVVRMPEQELEAFRRLEMWSARIQLVPTIAREMIIDQTYTFKAEKFANFQVPSLLLLGGDSPPLFRQAIEVLEAALPHSQTAVLPNQQHIAMDTAPDLFVKEVLDFLG
jgi:pimeloyl-ACP methyl ester carboxylesterase/Tfp pilus assembly protein PilF